jgi:hypothetical protein
VSANLHRRHLSTSERIEIAAKIAEQIERENNLGNFAQIKSKRGPKTHKRKAEKQAANLMNVSERSVRGARSKKRSKNPMDVIPNGPPDSPQVIWQRGVWNRAQIAIGDAMFEDWSHFTVDLKLVNAAMRASEAWSKLAAYLKKLHENQSKKAKTK